MSGCVSAVGGASLCLPFVSWHVQTYLSRCSSYSGYGKIGFDRRFRVYDVSDYGETIRTYKRTEHDEIVDDMVLAGHGAPLYEGS